MNYGTVLGYMGADDRKGRLTYRKFIKWGIEKDRVNPLDLGKGLGIVGKEDFVEWVKDKFLSKTKGDKREQPKKLYRKSHANGVSLSILPNNPT